MTFQTKLKVTSAISVLVTLFLCVLIVLSTRGINSELTATSNSLINFHEFNTTDQIVTGIFQLSTLTNEYLLTGDQRPEQQWYQKALTLEQLFKSVESADLYQNSEDLSAIHEDFHELEEYFNALVLAKNYKNETDNNITKKQKLRLGAQIQILSQAIITDINTVKTESQEAYLLQIKNVSRFLLGYLLLLIIFLIVTPTIFSKGIVGPLKKLGKKTEQLSKESTLPSLKKVESTKNVTEYVDNITNMVDKFGQSHQHLKQTITDLKKTSKLKDEYLNIATHELKTPLTSIIGLSDILKTRGHQLSKEKTSKYIDVIHTEALRLKDISQQALSLALYENERIDYNFEQFELVSYIRSLEYTLERLVKRHDSTFEWHTRTESIQLTTDKSKVTQVLYNLVDNAAKYGKPGQRINILIKQNKKFAMVAVIDEGPGIDKNNQSNIFNRFTSIRPSPETPTVDSSGLGLYICKKIIRSLEGKIGVMDNPNGGSIFYFLLPRNKPRS